MPSPAGNAKPIAPISAAVAAAILILVVLPNPFRLPQQNPTATAEYAPVPGNSEEDAENANFGETGLPGSSGIGAGGSGFGDFLGGFGQSPPEFRPRQKRCFGSKPPRQTEDPLSPTCVPYFDGDNKGSTFTGVTRNEIKVVLYNGLGIEGDMTTPWQPSDDARPGATNYENVNIVRTVKAQLRYFQQRYQTYGRTVRVIGQEQSGTSCQAEEGDAGLSRKEHKPFAAVVLGDAVPCYQRELAQQYKTPSFGLSFSVKRSYYEANKPYIWGFMPDQESMTRWSATFICDKLWQNGAAKAKFSDSTDIKGKPRRFALIVPKNHFRGTEMREEALLLQQDMKQRCGLQRDDDRLFVDEYSAQSTIAPSGRDEAFTLMSKYKTENVTTIICYCIPVQPELTVRQMQNAASALNYFPEWYWDDSSAMDRGIWQQTQGNPDHWSFGTSYLWRAEEFQNQQHYKAYSSVEPGTQPNSRFNWNIYHLFLNLFEAIQAAGPELNPTKVEQGMFTFRYIKPENPFVPTGGYGPDYLKDDLRYGNRGLETSDYTWVDTAMGYWWDPDGTPPGGRPGSGCIRPIHGGRRFFAQTWPPGDGDLFTDRFGGDSQPCSQDMQKLADPGTATSP